MNNHEIAIHLARLEEKLDAFLFRTSSTEGRLDDHDIRIRDLEGRSHRVFGVAAALAVVAGTVSQFLPIG